MSPTPVAAVLQPYNDAGGQLFPPGSVEANWYQWDGRYVVLYRGWDASATTPICPGNSIEETAGVFAFISNAPYQASADEVCVDAPSIAPADKGVRTCGGLLYYLTEIPVDENGIGLSGTLETNDGSGFAGQTSAVQPNAEATPEFEPEAAAYSLPPSGFDDLTTITCDG